LRSLKEINYCIHDIRTALDMRGKIFSNLRWRLNKFRRAKHRVEHIPISEAGDQIIHLIGQWRRQATTVRSSRQAYNSMSEAYDDLVDDLRAARAELRDVTTVTVVAEPETLTTVITDTVIADVGVRTFQLTFEGAVVSGQVDSTTVTGAISYTPIDMFIVVSKVGDMWQTDLQAPPWVTVAKLRTTVVDTKPTWWQKALPWLTHGAALYVGLKLGLSAR